MGPFVELVGHATAVTPPVNGTVQLIAGHTELVNP